MPIRQSLAVVCVSLGITIASASPVFAHAALTGSSHDNKSTVTDISEVSVTANEELLDIGKAAEGFVLAVRDAENRFYGDGCVSVDGDTASMPIALTEEGRYRVSYRIVSNDGHPIEGSFSFTFAGIDGAEPTPAFAERPECGVAQDAIVIAEPTDEPTVIDPSPTAEPAPAPGADIAPWIGIAGVAVLGGAVWVLFRTLRRSESEDDVS